MKARAFSYQRVATVDEALASFAACEGEARFLAGGQSLLPALSLRLDAPDLLVDISRIEALQNIVEDENGLRIGALVRHTEILRSPLISRCAPLLAVAAQHIAHPAIRNQGTIGGSLALADPAAEFPACVLALGARLEIVGERGVRTVAADDFFRDLYETAIRPGELLTAILVPPSAPGAKAHFNEFARRRGDFALVGLAANGIIDGTIVTQMRLVFCSVGPTPIRAKTVEASLIGSPLDAHSVLTAQAVLDDELSPDDTEEISGNMRKHLARVLLGRVLNHMASVEAR